MINKQAILVEFENFDDDVLDHRQEWLINTPELKVGLHALFINDVKRIYTITKVTSIVTDADILVENFIETGPVWDIEKIIPTKKSLLKVENETTKAF